MLREPLKIDMHTQSLYQQAIKFATQKHVEQQQLVPGTNLPYVVHLSNVAMEILVAALHTPDFDLDFAVQVALLHDTIEDTQTTPQELITLFGLAVAEGVAALTKDSNVAKSLRMADSLQRIKRLRKEAWAIKLADRITNLQQPPPDWNTEKKVKYREEAGNILETLKGGNTYLENRLREKINEYAGYINNPPAKG